MYLLAGLGALLGHFFPSLTSFTNLTLVGRALSALFDSGTVLLTALLALRLVRDDLPGRPRAWNVAFFAAALVTFTPLQLQLAHFYAVDSILLFFVMLTLLACVALVQTERVLRWSTLAALAYGLALGTKFSAAPLAVPICVAFLLRWYARRDFLHELVLLVYSALLTIVVFLLVEPYALLDRVNFIQQVAEQGDLARGNLDLPYVRQFAGTIPFLYEAQNMFLWGMGITLGLAALAGLIWFCRSALRREGGLWLILLSWVVTYGVICGSFYVKFMRYMLPLYPVLTLLGASFVLLVCQHMRMPQVLQSRRYLAIALRWALPVIVLAGTMFQGLALLNVYSVPNTRIQASRWMYQHLPAGSVLTYEQWDDPLPVAVDGHDPSMFTQATYTVNNQPTTGLDLYGDDTIQKAQQLADILANVDVITMPTDRLDKSIPRLPARYPLTIHYYQLLFNGQLGFRLAAKFENRPNLFGITLDDSNADESYSVFDHPVAKIFVRETHYTSQQLYAKLMAGVHLPAAGAGLSGTQRALVLSQQQINADQSSPSFGEQFPASDLGNTLPVLVWWALLLLLSWLVYPLLFAIFPGLADRGYMISKPLSLLFLAYIAWLLASLHLLPFSSLSLWLTVVVLALVGGISFYRQRRPLWTFLRERWRLLLLFEVIFTLAFLLLVGIRSLNPDLWNIMLGGEKPMELAFLNAILRSPYMPPLDPWFSGGYINYYYYGYVIVAALIKLTGIVPTTAFNLAIPLLFALTFSGVVALVYNLLRKLWVALLAAYFAALIGNFNGFIQLKSQLLAWLGHLPLPAFDYWQSSRVIPLTINEFPFWSFIFADLHPHVIDFPLTVCMLSIIAALLRTKEAVVGRSRSIALYVLASFMLATIAVVNPWDMPLYALMLAAVVLLQTFRAHRGAPFSILGPRLLTRVLILALVYAGVYLFYLPFYIWYQQLYVNGVGVVKQGSDTFDYLTVFGFWLFLALSFFLTELYRLWLRPTRNADLQSGWRGQWRAIAILSGCILLALILLLLGLKLFLAALLLLGVALFFSAMGYRLPWLRTSGEQPRTRPLIGDWRIYTYILLLAGVGVCLGIELVYIRDFLDGSEWERMNTVFKFSMQAWLCLAVAGACVVYTLWKTLSGYVREVWFVFCIILLCCCSIFTLEGPPSRIADHSHWLSTQKGLAYKDYTPSLDGMAFMRVFYPEDAQAISWLNAHVSGSPVILEADEQVSYQWYSRVSVFTGLPTVLGWPDHESEQRYTQQLQDRLTDIDTIYTTLDKDQALQLLQAYHVQLVYVGPLERSTYGAQSMAGLDKFASMPELHAVYRSAGVTIYSVASK
jgi:YYY domain-containing protein